MVRRAPSAGAVVVTRSPLPRRQRLLRFQHPGQVVVVAFAAAVALGTALLLVPAARAGTGRASVVEALFTATSAVCVTGHVVVDTPTYWSLYGELVILALIQVGGFGIMTLASLLGLVISRRMGLRSRLTAAAESKTVDTGDVRRVLVGVVKVTVLFEAATAAVLFPRLALAYDEAPGAAAYHAVFLAVSSFNNAGFAPYSDNLVSFVADPWVTLPLSAAVIAGGIGFPVLFELRRELRPRLWSVHTKITVAMYVLLVTGGTAVIVATEWDNAGTLGPLGIGTKILAAFVLSVMARTAGFNNVDVGALDPATLLSVDVLMFIGGGSAGTAGGIKVTTFALLFFVIVAEVRGDRSVVVFDRRVGEQTQRVALTVALVAVAVVVTATLVLLEMTRLPLDALLFEVISAFATVGLSTGITADLPAAGQLLLVALMFAGRVGPITLASALALRRRERLYELPEGRPIIG